MTVANPSFEIQAAAPAGPGRPADWTVNTVGAARSWAVFGSAGPTEGEARETFETGWPFYVNQFVASLVTGDSPNIELTVFDVGPAERKYEDFESGWAAQQLVPAMPASEAAVFDGNLVETFAWPPITYAYDPDDLPSELEFVDFSGTGGADDFEQGWRNDTWYDGGVTPDWTSEYAEFVEGAGSAYNEKFFGATTRFLIEDVNFTDNRFVHAGHTFGADQMKEIVPGDADSRAPTPFSYETAYYTCDITATEFGLALAPGGSNLPITGVGNGENYVTGSRRQYWVTIIEI